MITAESKLWYLKRSRLFERATHEAVANHEHLFTQVYCAKRAFVFEQGDSGRLVYVVKSGRVKVGRMQDDGKEIMIAILGPGDLFGEEVLFSEAMRSTFASCLEHSLLYAARANDLYGLLMRQPVVAINVAKYLRKQRDDAMSFVEGLVYLHVPARLLKLFEKLALEFGVESKGGTLIDVRLTQNDIASLIGSARETVSIGMTGLARDGRIELRGGRVFLPAPPQEVSSMKLAELEGTKSSFAAAGPLGFSRAGRV